MATTTTTSTTTITTEDKIATMDKKVNVRLESNCFPGNYNICCFDLSRNALEIRKEEKPSKTEEKYLTFTITYRLRIKLD